jgi:hypothetical protein
MATPKRKLQMAALIPFPSRRPAAVLPMTPDGYVNIPQLLEPTGDGLLCNVEGDDERFNVLAGDRLLVDCGLEARAGDMVIVRENDRQYTASFPDPRELLGVVTFILRDVRRHQP